MAVPMMVVPFSVAYGFVSGGCTGDLDKLDNKEHSYPYKLEARPNGEDDGKGVTEDEGANALGKDVALGLEGRGGLFEICIVGLGGGERRGR